MWLIYKMLTASTRTDLSVSADVPLWLKGLRLHKYCTLLAGKSYEELLSVGEAQLEAWVC